MKVYKFPQGLGQSDRYVEAQVVGQGVGPEGRSVSFQVDCRGIRDKQEAQAFVVAVQVDSSDDINRLTMHHHLRVVLSESRTQPEFIELVSNDAGRVEERFVRCEEVRALGDSRTLSNAIT